MSLVLTLHPPAGDERARRNAILSALALDDDGGRTFEIGRADTGATCVLVDDGGDGWHLLIPLMRSPTSARDLLPPIAAAIALGLPDRPLPVDELIALWDDQHRAACRDLMAMCEAQGSPPPPHIPREQLERLHGWLVARRGTPILGVDFQDGGPVLLAVPDGDPLAGTPGFSVLRDVDGVTRLFVPEEPEPRGLERARIVTPVEIVDSEALA
jgi:hypothetical protein